MILINGIILISILFLFFLLSMVWPPDSPWAPWWRTSKKVARAACKLAKIDKDDVMYELGSGDANFLITAAKEFGVGGVGIEIDPLRVFVSRLLLHSNRVSDRVKIVRGNFFEHNFSQANVVFLYLVPKALEKLRPKLLRELHPGTRIVSLRYEMNLPLKKYDAENNLRLYVIPAKST